MQEGFTLTLIRRYNRVGLDRRAITSKRVSPLVAAPNRATEMSFCMQFYHVTPPEWRARTGGEENSSLRLPSAWAHPPKTHPPSPSPPSGPIPVPLPLCPQASSKFSPSPRRYNPAGEKNNRLNWQSPSPSSLLSSFFRSGKFWKTSELLFSRARALTREYLLEIRNRGVF